MAKRNIPPLEQCGLCSTHYLRPEVAIPRPVLNKLLYKMLEIKGIDFQTFCNQYIPFCEDCIGKVRRLEILRCELDALRNEIVASVLDTLLHIRSDESTPLDNVKDAIINRWNTPQPRLVLVRSDPEPMKSNVQFQNRNTQVVVQNPIKEIPMGTEITDKSIVNVNWTVAEDYYVGSVVEVETSENYDFGGHDEGGGEDININYHQESKGVERYDVSGNNTGKGSRKLYLANGNVDCQNNPPPFFCDNCGRTYSVYKNAMIHMKLCREDPEKYSKICVFCSEDYSSGSWYQLKMHYDADHPGTALEKCFRCRHELLPGVLNSHICGGAIVKPHEKMECELCNLSFNTSDTLQKHVGRRHKDLIAQGKTFACEVCGKTYVLKSMLDRHSKVHQRVTDSKWQCDICNVYLSTRTGLKQHKTKHTGEMPFECDVCHKRFRMASVLRCHKVVHTKEKNHACTICGEKFSLYSIMFRHWKRHQLPSGEGTYRCPIVSCFRVRFRRVFALKDHMKNEHRGTPEYDEVIAKYKNVDDRTERRKELDGERKRKRKAWLHKRALKQKSKKSITEILGESEDSENNNGNTDEILDNEEMDPINGTTGDGDPLGECGGSDFQEEGADDNRSAGEGVDGDDSAESETENRTGNDANSDSTIKRSARLAAKRKAKKKWKSKFSKIKVEESPSTSRTKKKYKPGPKSKTRVKKEPLPAAEGVSLDDHGDLITIKEEPTDEPLSEGDAENAENDNVT